jgi:predicted lipid-binding transport protein (Tim44 family)
VRSVTDSPSSQPGDLVFRVARLAAEGARQSSAGLGVVVGLLNGIRAAATVLGPLVAGLAVGHLSPRAVFGLTEAACTAALAATVAVAWRTRNPLRS